MCSHGRARLYVFAGPNPMLEMVNFAEKVGTRLKRQQVPKRLHIVGAASQSTVKGESRSSPARWRKLPPGRLKLKRSPSHANFLTGVERTPVRVMRRLRGGETRTRKHDAEIFVGVLGASSYSYAEATFTQTLPDWIGAHVRMFRFFGGVPRLIVPDNLKNGVHKASFYDPEINRSYGMMAARP